LAAFPAIVVAVFWRTLAGSLSFRACGARLAAPFAFIRERICLSFVASVFLRSLPVSTCPNILTRALLMAVVLCPTGRAAKLAIIARGIEAIAAHAACLKSPRLFPP
jgi:hypothetical protein